MNRSCARLKPSSGHGEFAHALNNAVYTGWRTSSPLFFICNIKDKYEQGSPPAWTQEAHRIASTPSALLSRGEGGGIPSLAGGTPCWGNPPRKDMGPVEELWDGGGTLSPGCGQTDTCGNSTSNILRMRAVMSGWHSFDEKSFTFRRCFRSLYPIRVKKSLHP